MRIVRSMTVLAVLVAAGRLAAAEPMAERADLLGDRWPSVPEGHGLSLEDQVADRLTQLGNELGRHLDLLSHDMFQLTVDGRHRHAHLRVGGGNAGGLAFRVDSDIHFEDVNAEVHARIDLGFHGHSVSLELPAFEMSPAEYHGDYGVELKLPLYVRKF